MVDLFGENNWIYKKTDDNRARFVLGEKGENPLVCIGVNPSTAEPGNLDPTLRNVKKFSKLLGYDGWIMLNLYPQRATNPNDLHENIDPILHIENWTHAHIIAEKYSPKTVWAAWGTLIEKRRYLISGLSRLHEVFMSAGASWITIGKLSKAGHPHHPLYLAHKSKFSHFDISGYLANLKQQHGRA